MGARFDHDELAETHEINVTPFIDVMLVLLIIFMVAAPLATVDMAVDLPASTAEPRPRHDKPIVLTLKPDFTIALNDAPVSREALGDALREATSGDATARILLCADKAVLYGHLIEVMNLLRTAGFLKVALVGVEKVQP